MTDHDRLAGYLAGYLAGRSSASDLPPVIEALIADGPLAGSLSNSGGRQPVTYDPSRRPRVPLRDEPLEFAREAATGRVHVLPQQGGAGSITQRVTMLCNTTLTVGLKIGTASPPASYVGGDAFDDNDLCGPCVEALGDQSWRLPGSGYRSPR
jgi:hypothetical protein